MPGGGREQEGMRGKERGRDEEDGEKEDRADDEEDQEQDEGEDDFDEDSGHHPPGSASPFGQATPIALPSVCGNISSLPTKNASHARRPCKNTKKQSKLASSPDVSPTGSEGAHPNPLNTL